EGPVACGSVDPRGRSAPAPSSLVPPRSQPRTRTLAPLPRTALHSPPLPGSTKPSPTSMDSLVREIAHIPTVPVHDPAGETFGRYRVVKLIGKGGMGRVYEADD